MTGGATEDTELGTVNGIVDEPMTTTAAFMARLMTVFETVMAEPGRSV